MPALYSSVKDAFCRDGYRALFGFGSLRDSGVYLWYKTLSQTLSTCEA